MDAAMRQYCTFTLAGQLLGIDVAEVQEVVLPLEITRVPRAPRLVRGLINLRGQIVMAIDLRHRLGFPPCREEERPLNLVLRSEHGAVSFLIDEIRDVVAVDDSQFEATPDTVHGALRELLLGVCKLDGRLLLVLDQARLLAVGSAGARPRAPVATAAE